jgi:hypothetical protein
VDAIVSVVYLIAIIVLRVNKYRVRQKDLPYLERALCELWWGYGGGRGIDR